MSKKWGQSGTWTDRAWMGPVSGSARDRDIQSVDGPGSGSVRVRDRQSMDGVRVSQTGTGTYRADGVWVSQGQRQTADGVRVRVSQTERERDRQSIST